MLWAWYDATLGRYYSWYLILIETQSYIIHWHAVDHNATRKQLLKVILR